MKRIIIMAAASILAACGPGTETYGRNFSSLGGCVMSIEASATERGLSMKVYQDTQEKVSGPLSNGLAWACEKRESGTQGTYYHGWYMLQAK